MPPSPQNGVLRFGAFQLEPRSGELLKHGVRLKLHDKPFQVLQALLEHPGEVITRKELQERLWPGDTFVEFENGLNNAISRLRETLGDAADTPRFVETVPRRGYRFVAPVEAAVETPAEIAHIAPAPELRPVVGAHGRWMLAAAMAMAVVLAVAAYFQLRPAAQTIDSVAVLPFVAANAQENSQDEYVAFGMTEALIAELSRISALKVISQTSVLQYKGARKPLPQIARELGVRAVVEGSVIHEGEQVRITVQLIDAVTDTHLWAETYRRGPADVLSQQGNLAQAIAGEIRERLIHQKKPKATAARVMNPQSHEAYLKGRYFLQKSGIDSLRRARGYFEQAIAADSIHAQAFAGLADSYTLDDSMPPEVALIKAKASALKAIQLDETLADAHASLAYVYYYSDWNWREAEREFQRAIELDPSHSRARRWYGRFLGTMGRHREAGEQMQRAIELDPLSIDVHDSAAMEWFFARQPSKTIEQGRKILELDSSDLRGYEHLTVGYIHANQFTEAVAEARKGLALAPQNPLFVCLLASALGRASLAKEAEKSLEKLEQMSRKDYVPDIFLAVSYSQAGKKEQAMRWLLHGFAQRDPYMVIIQVSPWFDPLRDDPRFQDIVRRMKFPQ